MPGPIGYDAPDAEEHDNSLDLEGLEADPVKIAGHELQAQGSDETKWLNQQELEQQLKDVMSSLKYGLRRWGDDGPSDVPPLELYKKWTLANKRSAEATRATALHILARKYQTDYADIPGEIIQPVIRDLLMLQSDQISVETRLGKKRKEEPILKVAITFNNDEFIHQVKEAWPEGFSALLDTKDSDDKNALHHIFAWPGEKVTTRPEADAKLVLKRAMAFVPVAKKETIAAQDADGNTPIHYASDYRQCYLKTEEYVAMYKDMVRKADELMKGECAFNNRDESPILYGQRALAHCERIMLERKNKKEQMAANSKLTRLSTISLEIETPQSRREVDSPIDNLVTPEDSQCKTKGVGSAKEPKAVKVNGRGFDKSKINGLLGGDGSRHMSMVDEFSKQNDQNGSALTMRSSIIDMVYDDAQQIAVPCRWPNQLISAAEYAERPKLASEKTVTPTVVAASKKTKGKSKAYNAIMQFLMLHYIRSRSDIDARDLIYGKDASDKNLHFDASGHSRADDITTLIDRMSIGGFQDTLAYVYIPSLEQTTPVEKLGRKSYGTNRRELENPKMGRSDLVGVFDKLSSCGVTRILRLQVDDLEGPSHTDSAIEMALLGREFSPTEGQTQTSVQPRNQAHPSIIVETWDWRKPDISPDVIAAAAPNVEHVNLYWSGNRTVLLGWGSTAGIPQLKNLKTLQVYANPGLESVARMNNMLEVFQNDIISNTNGSVKEVKIILRINGLAVKHSDNEERNDVASIQVGGKTTIAQGQQHVWVSTMDEFRKSMTAIHKMIRYFGINMEPCRVKIALIDDGLDLNQLLTYNGTVRAMGQSYLPPDGHMENPWYRSSGGQGTVMANMITRVNPWVSLYVMKVHRAHNDKRPSSLERANLAESAARAIRGAIRRRVNIISISWTLKAKRASWARSNRSNGTNNNNMAGAGLDPEAEAIGKLEAAIDEAVRRNILIFCSASDRIEEEAKDLLPYRQAPDHVFRIGAALPHGQPAPQTEDKDNIDYFLPGIQVAEDFNPRGSKLPRSHDGSAVATALAAGLASLVMHCTAVMREYNMEKNKAKPGDEGKPETEDPTVQDYYTKAAAALQSRENMKQAFDNIGTGKVAHKYLEVWKEFGAVTEEIADLDARTSGIAECNRKKMELLDELARRLCHKIKLDDAVHG